MTEKSKLTDSDLNFLAEHTDCDRQQLQMQFENFLIKHPNGKISRKDFRAIMKACFPSKDYAALEKRIFNMYDGNRDGYISFKEFMVVLYIMSNGTPEQNLRQIFRIFDANGDGKISMKEMKSIVKEIYHLLSDPENRSKKDLTESAFKEMDTNNDGKVEEDEFISAVMSHEKVATMLALKIVQVFDPDKA